MAQSSPAADSMGAATVVEAAAAAAAVAVSGSSESLGSLPGAGVIASIEQFFMDNGDKRVEHLRFMSNPWEVFFISIFYVYFCYDLGPKRLMRNRQAFDLVWTVRLFNTFILLLNVWLLSKFFTLLNWGYDIVGCAVSRINLI